MRDGGLTQAHAGAADVTLRMPVLGARQLSQIRMSPSGGACLTNVGARVGGSACGGAEAAAAPTVEEAEAVRPGHAVSVGRAELAASGGGVE